MPTITITDTRLTAFYKQNPDFDILRFNAHDPAEVSALHWQGLEQTTILNLLKKYQRLLRLHPDPKVAMTLLNVSQVQDTTPTLPEHLRVAANEATLAGQPVPQSPARPEELDSAQAIAAIPREQFVQQYGEAVGGAMEAQRIHENATTTTAKTMLLWANMHNLASPYFRAMQVNNTSSDISQQFKNMPDYQTLFGSLDFCTCDECASIFGAAAYFVDLLRITDEYITTPNAGTIDHFGLDSRRPDLAQIALTCKNTNDLVPFLDIVNNVLAIKMANIVQPSVSSDQAIDTAHKALATATYPFNLPFNLPLEQIRSYLGQLNTDLATLYKTFNAPKDAVARETLGLSVDEYNLITTPKPTLDDLTKAYGVSVSEKDLGGLANQDTFLKQTGLSRQDLQDLLTQNLSAKELGMSSIPHELYINQLLASGQSLHLATDGSNTIRNLDLPTLDRLHRFIRLARKLNWSFADLDWVLRSLQAREIDSATLQSIAKIKQLQARLNLPLNVLCSFWSDLKTIGVGTAGSSQAPFDIIFNNPRLLGKQAPYHPRYEDEKNQLINPFYTGSLLEIPKDNSRIAAGLRVSLDDFTMLVSTFGTDGKLKLTVQNLSLLYRHSLLASLVKLPIDQYLIFLRITNKQQPIDPLDELLYHFEISDWLRASDFSVYEVDYILNGTSSKYVASKHQKANIEPFLQALSALGISPQPALTVADITDWTSLAKKLKNSKQPSPGQRVWELLTPGMREIIEKADKDTTQLTDQQKSDFVKELNTILQLPDFYEANAFANLIVPLQAIKLLQEGVDLSENEIQKLNRLLQAINLLQAGVILSENEIQKLNRLLLEAAYPQEIAQNPIRQIDDEWKEKLIQQLATFVGSTTDRVEALMEAIAGSLPLPKDIHSYIEVFLYKSKDTKSRTTYIEDAFDRLSRGLILAEKLQLTSTEIDSVRTSAASYAVILQRITPVDLQHITPVDLQRITPVDLQHITIDNLQSLFDFKQLTLAFQDTQNQLVGYFAKAAASAADLAAITGWSKEQIEEAATGHFKKMPHLLTSVAGLVTLKKAFDLSTTMGVNISFHDQLMRVTTSPVKDNWAAYTTAAAEVINTVKGKYNDDDWAKVSDAINSALNEAKRSRLAGFVLWKLDLKNLRTLSEYLLVDVEMTGCASISLIKQGILSVQMYLQRCRLNIEPGVTSVKIPEIWWEWLLNYRIWQANRKVFLYPENYIDPGLRKSKSDLFQELQSELLQSDITQDAVAVAYQHYFDKFAELANLRIAASYRAFVQRPNDQEPIDTLFLFGRTVSEPATYYYRECRYPKDNSPTWTPWSKIDININADSLSPVFAFNKLFVFWVESQKTTSSDGSDKPKTTVQKATIKYTFQTISGTWIQPQTLAKDIVINVNPADYRPAALDLNTDKLFWKKVYALAIPEHDSEPDKILVMFGSMPSLPSARPQLPSPTSKDTAIVQFDQQVYRAQLQGYQAYQNGSRGYSSLIPAVALSSDSTTENKFLLLPQAKSGGNTSKIGFFVDGTTFAMDAADDVLPLNYIADAEHLPLPLMGYWPLDEGSGTAIYDKAGTYNGTLSGKQDWQRVTDFPGTSVRSVMQFGTSNNNSVSLPPESIPTGSEITLSFWAFGGASLPKDTVVIQAVNNKNERIVNIHLPQKNTHVYFDCGWDGEGDDINKHYDRIEKQAAADDYKGKWSHWTFTKNARLGEMKIYLNGRLWHAGSGKTKPLPAADKVVLGTSLESGDKRDYDGKIAELRIWNKALSAEQVLLTMSPLIKNLSAQNATAQTVKNQPDWSILDNGDEAFLVIPQSDALKPISEALERQDVGRDAIKLSYASPSTPSPTDLPYAFTRLTTNTIRQLGQKVLGGIDQLLTLDSQVTSEPDFARFQPSDAVLPPTNSRLDFSGPYGLYFQEIFFHIPFLIANTLTTNQRFAEAQKWYHYIFNPTRPQTLPSDQRQVGPNDQNLVGYWPLDEGSGTTIHDKAGSYNSTLSGKPNWQRVTDFPGTSVRSVMQFENRNSVSLPPESIPTGSEITLSFWAFASLPNTVRTVIQAVSANGQRLVNISLPFGGEVVYFDCGNDGEGFFPYDRIQKKAEAHEYEGKWSYWTFTKNARLGEMKIYLNGRLWQDGSGKTKPLPAADKVVLGATLDLWENCGKIAELRIWNKALSPEQILENMYAQSSDRFWHYLPFRGNTLQKLVDILQDDQAIAAYQNDPFDPNAIAQLRFGAYQKAVVMKYIDNLLDWGDSLFAQDTWESIAQATLLYFLANDLLGPRPESLGPCPTPTPKTFKDIKADYKNKPIPPFLIELEQLLDENSTPFVVSPPFNEINAYFCVSENDQFTAYWDRVEDRLYKIRHCQNIAGTVRQLALFEPPINPAELVRAAAAGNVPISVAAGLTAEVSHYRFDYLLGRAQNITSTLMQLGATLLSALEKKDAEQLSALRASQEVAIQQLITTTKQKQIDEANATVDSLRQSLTAAKHRMDYYQGLIGSGLIASERDSQNLLISAVVFEGLATDLSTIASPAYGIPTIYGLADGGFFPGNIVAALASAAGGTANTLNMGSSLAAIMAQYERRTQEWKQQQNMAQDDVALIEKQIVAAEITAAIATTELEIQQKSSAQAQEIEDFLQRKFSNQDLYQWMVNRLSVLYFQTFKLALDLALVAQKAYQFELNSDKTFIQFDYWDSLKQGLLAGEGLLFGLHQLEKAYIEGNNRRLEIEKTISLLQLDPKAFIDLKNTGKCQFELSEKLFDYDFPGHYCRQIKTVALSIPAVVGPYQNIKATLTQLSDQVLVQAEPDAVTYLLTGEGSMPDSSKLRSSWRRNQKIALSRGVNDSGMFELNFRDERYLPFEGTGAVSRWELRLPKASNRIDFDSLSDVIIHLSYTALDAGDSTFTTRVQENLKAYEGAYYMSFNQSFPGAWHSFLSTQTNQKSQQLKVSIPNQIIPPHLTGVNATKICFKLDVPDGIIEAMNLQIGNGKAMTASLNSNIATFPIDPPKPPKGPKEFVGDWIISVVPLTKDEVLDPSVFKNIECIICYKGEIKWEA